MNAPSTIVRRPSVCPHDCPSACALSVEVIDGRTIGRVRGAEDQAYTAGVICAKVARYAERVHHPDRLMHPLKRVGPKGSGQFARIAWDEALDTIAAKFLEAERDFGAQSVWPYYYAGTMGRVMRDGINRLAHVKKYSRFFSTICVNLSWPGFLAGTGRLAGADPREMAKADCVVIWGTNAASTQVNVLTHATRARKERGAKIVAIDIYRTETVKQADLGLVLRPGTDGALACAVMHVLFRDGLADWEFLERYTDAPRELQQHLTTRDPAWAARITGLTVDEIEAFARLVGERKKTFFRLGYGFTRQRNGAVAMHAALCVPAVTGAWAHEGGGAHHSNNAIYRWSDSLIQGLDAYDRSTRALDQSRIGAILCGEDEALQGGPPVKAMLIQNTNPAVVAPDQRKVRQGFLREDLFVAVHEQFMTETALVADIVLPATMFVEHDDIYSGGGHQYIEFGGKLIEPPGECRNNHDVICAIAKRVGAEHRGFEMSPRAIVDATLQASGWGSLAELEKTNWRDCQPSFDTSHYRRGFAWPDGKFRFRPDWAKVPFVNDGLRGPWRDLPRLPDHWETIEEANADYPFRLATSPARQFLNSSFTETPTSRRLEGRPSVMIHPDDAAALGVGEGDVVRLESARGALRIHVRLFDGLKRGVVIAEGIWPNAAHLDGEGINVLTGADAPAPFGGAAVHDSRVRITRAG
ncbi:MAG: molybdopterin oxidoreductase family protein [Methylobacteriaceae bacterium]|nr:molybdopterin oxidoreductase family protein [Methylobacteriaceae bacterium]